MLTQADRITKARMKVILDAPFFGSLLMRLQMIRDDSVPTFCTDGKVIRYHEAFCARLTDAELCGVLVHEVCHCAQGHLWRMGQREPRRWNVACDYQINQMLTEYVAEEKTRSEQRGGGHRFVAPWTLPEGGLLDPQFAGMASEDIYAKLPVMSGTSAEGAGDGQGKGKPGDGASSPGEFTAPASPAAAKEQEADWKIAVTQAAAIAKMRGHLPGSIQQMIGELLAPKVPWREVLREFVRTLARDDYSWAHANRRYLGSGFILPSLRSERMGPLIVARDTSGSTGGLLAEFNAEVQAALDECQPESLVILDCDAAIAKTYELQPGDRVPAEVHGGGGTCFEPVFAWIEKHCDTPPAALIYLTDLYGSFPKHAPDYPVLWAVYGEAEKAPFGQVLAVK